MSGGQEEIILYQAIASPIGVVVKVSDFNLASQRLYTARRKLCDPALAGLQFRRSPDDPEGEMWIVKGPLPEPKDV